MSVPNLKSFQNFLLHKDKIQFSNHVPQGPVAFYTVLFHVTLLPVHLGKAAVIISQIKEYSSFPSILGPVRGIPFRSLTSTCLVSCPILGLDKWYFLRKYISNYGDQSNFFALLFSTLALFSSCHSIISSVIFPFYFVFLTEM